SRLGPLPGGPFFLKRTSNSSQLLDMLNLLWLRARGPLPGREFHLTSGDLPRHTDEALARIAARQDNDVGTLGSANVLPANAQLSDGDRERDAETNPADDPSKAVGESDTHVVADENGP